MADDRSVIDALSDESKAVAINDLISRIQELTRATTAATQNLNKVRGERAAVDNAGGLTGLLARRIQDSRVSQARDQASALYSDLQAARLRLVNLTGSRITNFKRGRGESEIAALNRLGGLHAEYRTAFGKARGAGALVGQDYIDKREVDATAKQFLLNPNGARFQTQEPNRAAEVVSGYFGDKMQRLATLGGKYFAMANPMMQKMKPFFGARGFSPMVGLRAMGPLGIAASTGIGVARQYLAFNDRTLQAVNARENQAKLSGLGVGALNAFGGALGAFGGNTAGAARLSGNIAATLGGMRFGNGGGMLFEMARKFGMSLTGHGGGGLATTEEILYRIADLMHGADASDKELIAYMARTAGLSGDMVRLMEQGSKAVQQQVEEMKKFTVFLNDPEVLKRAEEYSKAKTESELIGEVASQKASSDLGIWWQNQFGNIKAGWATGDSPFTGFLQATMAGIGTIGSGIVGAVQSPFAYIARKFGNDYDSGYLWDLINSEISSRNKSASPGDSILGAIEGITSGFFELFSDRTYFKDEMLKKGEKMIGDSERTIPGASSAGVDYINIQQDIKVEANVTSTAGTMSGTGEDLGRATGEHLGRAARRAMAPAVGIGPEK